MTGVSSAKPLDESYAEAQTPVCEQAVVHLDAILRGEQSAWRAFVAEYDPQMRTVVRHAAEATHPLTEDEIDDVLGDFWLAVVADNKRMLRAFNPRRGAALLTWMTFHVARIAHERASTRASEPKHVPLTHARRVPDPRPLPTPRFAAERATIDVAIRECVRSEVVDVVRKEMAALTQQRDHEEADRPRAAAWWAEQLGCSAESLIKRAKRGSLEAVKIGARYYFTRAQIDGSRRWNRVG